MFHCVAAFEKCQEMCGRVYEKSIMYVSTFRMFPVQSPWLPAPFADKAHVSGQPVSGEPVLCF
jgi:hypothetical protein